MQHIFPKITHIDEVLPHIEGRPEIRLITHENGFKTLSYMLQNAATFENEWLRECRSITFNKNGFVAARTFHKFFNLNEKDHTQFDTLPWDSVSCIMEKRDGSMITTIVDVDEETNEGKVIAL